jgi:hypothetical protein
MDYLDVINVPFIYGCVEQKMGISNVDFITILNVHLIEISAE